VPTLSARTLITRLASR